MNEEEEEVERKWREITSGGSFDCSGAQVRKIKRHPSKVFDRLENLDNALRSWVSVAEESVEKMTKISNELDHYHKIARGAGNGGSKAFILGAGLAGVGLLLAPFSFGASLIPTGGLLAAGGKITAKGSKKIYDVMTRRACDETDKLLKKCQSNMDTLMKECLSIGNLLDGFWEIETAFLQWVAFWSRICLKHRPFHTTSKWSSIVQFAEREMYRTLISIHHVNEEQLCEHSIMAVDIRTCVEELKRFLPTDTEIETMIRMTRNSLNERLS
ncbi:unnamed protein product [Mytilus coruscus]|uniref:APOL n=1 Tax=Mytilus coruscus TaxID=42192 RepID=A0A6J8C9H1_MYTCO|nr:unnamed protein product [Mytilus coruscus]